MKKQNCLNDLLKNVTRIESVCDNVHPIIYDIASFDVVRYCLSGEDCMYKKEFDKNFYCNKKVGLIQNG